MWLWIVISAHILNAISFVVNKFILNHINVKPTGYAALIGGASALATFMIPWGFSPLPWGDALIALATGAVFIWAVYFFFTALNSDEVSTVVPVIGAAIPVITLILAVFLLGERLSLISYGAFVVLLIGTGLMVGVPLKKKKQTHSNHSYRIALCAAVLFALSSIGMKYIFNQTGFVNGFIWTRWGSVLGTMVFLFSRVQVRYIQEALRALFSKQGIFFGLGESTGAAGFVILTYAMSLASPTLINALQGVQYALLLGIAIFGWMVKPDLLKESFTKKEIILKTCGIVCIGLGVWMIAIL